MRLRRAHREKESAAGFSYTIFHPLYITVYVHHCTAAGHVVVEGWRQPTRSVHHAPSYPQPRGIRAFPPPSGTSRRGWNTATTPTLRNHLYLVDVTTYHPLSGVGGGGGGLRRDGRGSGGRRRGRRDEGGRDEEGKKNNEMNIGRESRNYYTSTDDEGEGMVAPGAPRLG